MLRQDPDVILIGELRDRETAETALQAAESGHLVLSTMHTLDAAETLGRLVEFFPASKQPQVRSILAGVLKGVISQRLLPRAGGGRVAAVEVMVANARVQELIRENRPEEVPEAIAEGAFFQMQTLTQALIDLVVRGEVDEETAAAAAPNRHDFTIPLARALKQKAVEERSAAAADSDEPTRSRLAAPTPCAWSDAGFRTASEGCSRTASPSPRCSSCSRSSESSWQACTALHKRDRRRADQTNRTEAQQHARLGLDKLRREIHCASAVTPTERLPGLAVTVTLGSYCQTTGGATTVTWCTKDGNGATPPVAGAQPYTLWRYVGSTCSGHRDASGRRTSWTLRASPPARSSTRQLPPGRDAHSAATGGTLPLGDLFVRRHGAGAGARYPGVAR